MSARGPEFRIPEFRILASSISLIALLFLSVVGGCADPEADAPRLSGASSAPPHGGSEPPDGMSLVPAGEFEMGHSGGHDDEAPVHRVAVKAFFLGRHEVTNAEFAAFVAATGHRTRAEADGHAWCYIEGEREFRRVEGADWRHPQGPGSDLTGLDEHPVVCVSWHDAKTYARWAGGRLPTEAEWEYAARAGNRGHLVADTGSGETPREAAGRTVLAANVWQGTWPDRNLLSDGWFYTAPAGTFPGNAYGVADMLGNVWEWCADWYEPDAYTRAAAGEATGSDPMSGKRVARGGSWFCSANYCSAYSTHFRGASPPDRAFNNVGFRIARGLAPAAPAPEVKR